MNRVAERVTGEILVLSMLNAFYKPDAIGNAAPCNFAGPPGWRRWRQLEHPVEVAEGAQLDRESHRWYESSIKRRESELLL